MKRPATATYVGSAILALVGTYMAMTNPGQDDYNRYAAKVITEFVVQDLCQRSKDIPAILGASFREHCTTVARSSQASLEGLIANSTERQNFVFFSFYTTELPTRQVRALGLFNRFFLY